MARRFFHFLPPFFPQLARSLLACFLSPHLFPLALGGRDLHTSASSLNAPRRGRRPFFPAAAFCPRVNGKRLPSFSRSVDFNGGKTKSAWLTLISGSRWGGGSAFVVGLDRLHSVAAARGLFHLLAIDSLLIGSLGGEMRL